MEGTSRDDPRRQARGECAEIGVRILLRRISIDRLPDHVRLSGLEPLFACQACGTRPADLRPNFHGEK